MNKKLIATCMSLVAFAAMAVVPALASASPILTETTNVVVPVGAKVTGTQSGNILFTPSSGGVISCTKAVLTGTVRENSGTSIKGDIATAAFTGAGAGGSCLSTGIPFNPSFTVAVGNLPYCLTTEAGDTWTVRGGACAAAAQNIKFTLTSALTGACTYERASVSGTYETNKHPVTLKFNGGEPVNKTAGGVLCPAQGQLDGGFNLSTDNAEETPLTIG